MKRILAIGRVRNGGAVEITAPTLEERLAMQMERNAQVIERNRARLAEIDAMHRDLDALQREPNSFTCSGNLDELLDALDENPGLDYSTQPWKW